MSRKRYKKPRGPKLSHGQNFFKDSKTVRKLVKLARLSDQDLVIEIGPGEGVITRELADAAGRVIGVEFDRGLASRLKIDFAAAGNVEIVWFNFLKFKLPAEPYKLFANIPFNLTAP
ncbi:MAG: rRNA adenine N-6-methyltransferase family protein, partial [Chloroflexota bacterium]